VGFSAQFLNPSAAARQLGVSAKALRLYEQRGLVAPGRTAAGWRVYGPDEMARAAEIVALRGLGLSLSQIARVLGDDPQGLERQGLERQGLERQGLSAQGLEPALAAHQTMLEGRIRQLAGAVEKVRELRAGLAQGRAPTARELARLLGAPAEISVAFDLPWPWGGERFELRDVRPLNYIIGPLGSGKTRLAKRLAETLPDAAFLGLDRLAQGASAARARLDADPALKSRVDRALAWLVEHGASTSEAFVALLVGLESEAPAMLVVDMVEQGLDQGTQEALIAHLRRRGPAGGRFSCSRAPARSWTWPPWVPKRRSFSVPPITARRPVSPPIPALQATRRSPLAWPRPRCGRGRKASSPGGPRWREAASAHLSPESAANSY
jgi:DNA-binding transcriptional MerR regulator